MSWFGQSLDFFKNPSTDTLPYVLDPILAHLSETPDQPSRPNPLVPGPTHAEVVASDQRLRKALANQRGRSSTVITGGLTDTSAKITMPTLVGTKGGA